MSAIANKRKLVEAVHELVKKSEPDLPDMQAAAGALAQVFSDMLGIDVTLILRMGKADVDRLVNDARVHFGKEDG
ncbi:hypothetical protein [Burkholderia sp. Ac-20349]|uniref:hypothetical protein n=1 Tax=Burkholderia sp. Ac-20349 TaxID=2703893 RepID=UPI00197C7571|nr:hypothetical protein [Burkholderia sp. Ac-20349]MBN3839314.1 hypothetical protein [Burkholderia sp. Ac-20349]